MVVLCNVKELIFVPMPRATFTYKLDKQNANTSWHIRLARSFYVRLAHAICSALKESIYS